MTDETASDACPRCGAHVPPPLSTVTAPGASTPAREYAECPQCGKRLERVPGYPWRCK